MMVYPMGPFLEAKNVQSTSVLAIAPIALGGDNQQRCSCNQIVRALPSIGSIEDSRATTMVEGSSAHDNPQLCRP